MLQAIDITPTFIDQAKRFLRIVSPEPSPKHCWRVNYQLWQLYIDVTGKDDSDPILEMLSEEEVTQFLDQHFFGD